MYATYNILIKLLSKGGIVYTEQAAAEPDIIAYTKKLISKYGSNGDEVFIWRVDNDGTRYYYNSENKFTVNREPWCQVG